MAGLTIPGEVYAWIAVFVLPVNSALNPFMYSLSAILRKQVGSVPTFSSRVEAIDPAAGRIRFFYSRGPGE